MAEPKAEQTDAETLTADDMKNIVAELTRPHAHADLQTAGYFITLCNKLTRMINVAKTEE